jgi:hypothetical protein
MIILGEIMHYEFQSKKKHFNPFEAVIKFDTAEEADKFYYLLMAGWKRFNQEQIDCPEMIPYFLEEFASELEKHGIGSNPELQNKFVK